MQMTTNELAAIAARHNQWLKGHAGGRRADLSDADLSRADLWRANVRRGDFRRANLSDSDLSDSDLSRADFRGADLSRCDLRGSDLSGCNLSGSKLSGSKLRGCNLRGANLSDSDLSDSDLSRANLSRCDLSGCNLMGEIIQKTPRQLSGLLWPILITEKFMVIGCRRHSHAYWLEMTDEQIAAMHPDAHVFWTAHKSALMSMCQVHATSNDR